MVIKIRSTAPVIPGGGRTRNWSKPSVRWGKSGPNIRRFRPAVTGPFRSRRMLFPLSGTARTARSMLRWTAPIARLQSLCRESSSVLHESCSAALMAICSPLTAMSSLSANPAPLTFKILPGILIEILAFFQKHRCLSCVESAPMLLFYMPFPAPCILPLFLRKLFLEGCLCLWSIFVTCLKSTAPGLKRSTRSGVFPSGLKRANLSLSLGSPALGSPPWWICSAASTFPTAGNTCSTVRTSPISRKPPSPGFATAGLALSFRALTWSPAWMRWKMSSFLWSTAAYLRGKGGSLPVLHWNRSASATASGIGPANFRVANSSPWKFNTWQ